MRLYLADDTAVELVHDDGAQMALLSPQPAPSGTPLQLHAAGGAPRFQIKVNRCRRDASAFRIEGRWVSLSRGDRDWLQLNATTRSVLDPEP